jgi:hypothetical protein
MRDYSAKEIDHFLSKVDSFLKKKAELILIGGTAALLAYKTSQATSDIDTWNPIDQLKKAYELAKKETGFDIPLSQTTVADPPYNFEDRLELYNQGSYKHLVVKVPEVIDLILMKTMRGYAHDLDAVEEMVRNRNVKMESLVDRYIAEMGSAVAPKEKRDLNFLAMIERCYPHNDIEEVEVRISE